MSITLTTDVLQKFIFENAAVRGEFIDISATWREVLSRHDYPPAVKKLLGQMVGAGALLSANLKFNGSIIMQIHGDGPVQLLVVECDATCACAPPPSWPRAPSSPTTPPCRPC